MRSPDGAVFALNNLSLDIYPGLTVLLGHNGAGKTTLVSVLTGLVSPTEGSGTVAGFSITEDMARIRSVLGVCPQVCAVNLPL